MCGIDGYGCRPRREMKREGLCGSIHVDDGVIAGAILQIDVNGKTDGECGVGLQDSSVHGEMGLLPMIFPDHDILDMHSWRARLIDPLLEKPAEVSSCRP